jgi:hypothetical protein
MMPLRVMALSFALPWLLCQPSESLAIEPPPASSSDSSTKKEIGSRDQDRLIQQLGNRDSSMREAAERELETIGKPALAALQQAANEQSDPEVRYRAKRLVDRIGTYRHEFAKLLSNIYFGMTKAQVLAIVGKPDDIRVGDWPSFRLSPPAPQRSLVLRYLSAFGFPDAWKHLLRRR